MRSISIKSMHQNKKNESHYRVTYLLFFMLFLVVGIFITVVQTQQSQNTNTHAATSTNCTVTAAKMQIKPKEQQLLDMVNQYRATKGAGKLVLNLALKQSSEWLSTDMLAHNNLSHTDSLGRTPDTRLTNCGFTNSLGYGENIAEANPDPAVILKLWQSDVPHDTILKDPEYNVAAVSFEQNISGTDSYWTMDFGTLSSNPNPNPNPTSATPPTPIPTVATTITNCTVSSDKLQTKPQEQQLFNMINQYRIQSGASQLTWSTILKRPAAWMSLDTFNTNNLSTIDSLGRGTVPRMTDCGYNTTYGYGELVSNKPPDPATVMQTLQNDATANKGILDTKYTIGAIGMEQDAAGTNAYWIIDLGGTAAGPGPTNAITQGNIPTLAQQGPTIDPNVPTPTPAKVTADMQLGVKIKISGIGTKGNPSPKHLSRRVTATIFSVGTTPVTSGTSFLTYDGSDYFTGTIHLGKLAEGPYFITFVSDGTLQAIAKPEFQNLRGGQINVIPPVTLYLGDMDANNILDINDYNLILPCFQTSQCDSASSIDFNDDGTTDVTDYNLLLQSYQNFHGS